MQSLLAIMEIYNSVTFSDGLGYKTNWTFQQKSQGD